MARQCLTAYRIANRIDPVSNAPVAGDDNPPTAESAVGKTHNPRRSILTAIICVGFTMLAYWSFDRLIPLGDAENYFSDYRLRNGRLAEKSSELVYISVDRTSYAGSFVDEVIAQAGPDDQYFMRLLEGEFPWTREIWGYVAGRLLDAGAKGVLLDFTFASEKPEDPELKTLLDKYSPRIVMGALVEVTDAMMTLVTPSPSLIEPNEFDDNLGDSRIGFANIHTDADGTVRRGLYDLSLNRLMHENLAPGKNELLNDNGQILHSLSSRGLRLLDPNADLPPPSTYPLIRYAGLPGTFEPISFKRLIDPAEWRTQFAAKDFFRDRLVIIGPGAAVFPDTHRTPFGLQGAIMDGPEIHLNYLNAALRNEFIAETSRPTNLTLILAAGGILTLLVFSLRLPWIRVATGLGLTVIFLGTVLWYYNQQNLMINAVATPIALLNLGILASVLAEIKSGGSPSAPPSAAASQAG
jgi:adenylate cyclase